MCAVLAARLVPVQYCRVLRALLTVALVFQGVPRNCHRHRPGYRHVVSLSTDQKHEISSQFAGEVTYIVALSGRVALVYSVCIVLL